MTHKSSIKDSHYHHHQQLAVLTFSSTSALSASVNWATCFLPNNLPHCSWNSPTLRMPVLSLQISKITLWNVRLHSNVDSVLLTLIYSSLWDWHPWRPLYIVHIAADFLPCPHWPLRYGSGQKVKWDLNPLPQFWDGAPKLSDFHCSSYYFKQPGRS